MEGEYGLNDICIGVPCIIGSNGIESIVDVQLNAEEKQLMSESANKVACKIKQCKQGKNFANKIWNAYRLIEGWEIDKTNHPTEAATEALDWYQNHFNKTIGWVDENFEKYRISDALMTIYKLIWDDFCSWLLELVKPEYGKPIDRYTHTRIVGLFENNLRLLHPFMPFLTEELWHFISPRETNHAKSFPLF